VGEKAAGESLTAHQFSDLLAAQIRRLYPPYLAALVLYVGCLMAEGLQWTPASLRDIGLNLVMLTNVDQGAASVLFAHGFFHWCERPFLSPSARGVGLA